MKSFMRGIVDHKGLLSILAVLVVAIIGLTAGIIISLKTNTSDNIAEEVEVEELNPEDVMSEAKRIYDDNPENASKVADYFKSLIEEAPNNEGRTYVAAWNLWYFFADIGDARITLDSMLRIDISALNDLDKYTWYSAIVSLADSIGDEEVKATYEPLKNSVRYAFDRYVEDTTAYDEYADRFVEEQTAANKEELEAYWESMTNGMNGEETE